MIGVIIMLYEEKISQCNTLEDLFAIWKNEKEPKGGINHRENFFIADGIVDENVWKSGKRKKILLVLKEAYGEDWGNNTLVTWLKNDHPQIGPWKRIAKIVYGIQNTTSNSIARYKEKLSKDEHNSSLEQIAVLNIKKSYGDSRSKNDELKMYAEYDRQEIKKEIELINPDIIVCGNTFQILYETVYQKNPITNASDNWYYYLNIIDGKEKRLFIDYYHPSFYLCPTLLYYYGLIGIYQQALLDK